MPGIGIITNPHSKLNKKRPETPRLLGYILGEHGRLEITQSLEDLEKVARKFRDSNIEILAINGGDGTISKTLSAFVLAYGQQPLPQIALLRGGTMNVLASNLGIHGTPPRILYRLCENYSGTHPIRIAKLRSLKIEGSIGFLYADGMAYRVLDEFYQNKTGPLGAAWLVFRIACSAIVNGKLFQRMIFPTALKMSTDGKPVAHDSLIALASTIERLPFGFRIFPSAKQSLSQFQYASVRCQAKELLWSLVSLLTKNQPKDYPAKLGGLCSQLSLETGPGYTYSLDGELFKSSGDQLAIELGPVIEFLIL